VAGTLLNKNAQRGTMLSLLDEKAVHLMGQQYPGLQLDVNLSPGMIQRVFRSLKFVNIKEKFVHQDGSAIKRRTVNWIPQFTPQQDSNFSPCQYVQSSCRVWSTSDPVSTTNLFPAVNWPCTSNQCRVKDRQSFIYMF
jgi:hypothetical protein